jgi:hypothetical protein
MRVKSSQLVLIRHADASTHLTLRLKQKLGDACNLGYNLPCQWDAPRLHPSTSLRNDRLRACRSETSLFAGL